MNDSMWFLVERPTGEMFMFRVANGDSDVLTTKDLSNAHEYVRTLFPDTFVTMCPHYDTTGRLAVESRRSTFYFYVENERGIRSVRAESLDEAIQVAQKRYGRAFFVPSYEERDDGLRSDLGE